MKLSVHEAYKTMLTEYPDILNAEQVAKLLQVETHRVYKMIDEGCLPAAKPGKRYLIPKFGLILYLLNEAKTLNTEIEKGDENNG